MCQYLSALSDINPWWTHRLGQQHHPTSCHPGTREAILDAFNRWMESLGPSTWKKAIVLRTQPNTINLQ
jgi:hypothetical protein